MNKEINKVTNKKENKEANKKINKERVLQLYNTALLFCRNLCS
jgi:hypothetical protein